MTKFHVLCCYWNGYKALQLTEPLTSSQDDPKTAILKSFLEIDEDNNIVAENEFILPCGCSTCITAKRFAHSFLFISITGYSLYTETAGVVACQEDTFRKSNQTAISEFLLILCGILHTFAIIRFWFNLKNSNWETFFIILRSFLSLVVLSLLLNGIIRRSDISSLVPSIMICVLFLIEILSSFKYWILNESGIINHQHRNWVIDSIFGGLSSIILGVFILGGFMGSFEIAPSTYPLSILCILWSITRICLPKYTSWNTFIWASCYFAIIVKLFIFSGLISKSDC